MPSRQAGKERTMEKKLLFIVNPRAGRNKSRGPLFDAAAIFSEAGYLLRIHRTTASGDATETVVREGSQYDLVVASGGDGTLNETIAGLVQLENPPLLGYLPQQFGYYPSYTPRQFLRYAAALQCIPKREADGRIDHLLETVGLGDAADKKMKKFSGGMLQRVGIAVAMLNDPKLLILDEPTAGLDPRERVRFRNLIHTLAEDRIVILSTHIVSDIETIAGQIVMFKDHRLYCCDSPARICARFQGRVFQLPAGTPLAPGQFLLSEGQGADGPVLRVLCETPPVNGTPVTPGLEDAFLAIYREEQT